MVIGTIGMPGRHALDGQSIKTKFFILGLPLFPTSCAYKVSQNLGIELSVTRKDMYHAYAKVHFGLIGLIGFVFSSNMRGWGTSRIIMMVGCAILLGLSLYSWIKHTGPDEEEMIRRRIFGKAFLYNMPPEYLPTRIQNSLFQQLQKTFIGRFNHFNWQEDIKNSNVTKENFAILYTLSYYQKTLQASPDHNYLFNEMESYLNKTKSLKTAGGKVDESKRWEPKSNFNPIVSSEPTLDNQLKGTPKSANKTSSYSSTFDNKTSGRNSSATGTAQDKVGANKSKGTLEKLTAKDIRKLHDAQDSIQKQLYMFAGLLLFGFIVAAVIMPNKANLVWVFLMTFAIWAIIAAFVFMGDYRKIGKDLNDRNKIKVKVRVKDLAVQSDTAYFAFQPNPHGIEKAQASSKYYSTGLLNKEIEMYVSKESHTLLEIMEIKY